MPEAFYSSSSPERKWPVEGSALTGKQNEYKKNESERSRNVS